MSAFALTMDVMGLSLHLAELSNWANSSIALGNDDAKERVQELIDYIDNILDGPDDLRTIMYCLEHELEVWDD